MGLCNSLELFIQFKEFKNCNQSTMRALIVVICFAIAMADDGVPQWMLDLQHGIGMSSDVIDTVHNWRIEYHSQLPGKHLLIAISDGYDASRTRECHFIEIDSRWEGLLNDTSKTQKISEEIYATVTDPTIQETELTVQQLQAAYGDKSASKECWEHKIYVLSYTPSAALQASGRRALF